MGKINLELKHYCKSFEEIRKILKQLGVKKVEVKKQKDSFFNLPKNGKIPARLKMREEKGTQTFIYYERPDFQNNKATEAKIILYPVKDKKIIAFLEDVLGVQVRVEKIRELWKKGNTVFNLDEVKNVGKVFEIELQKKSKINKKDLEIFENYKNLFLPHLGKVIKGSNADLTLKQKGV